MMTNESIARMRADLKAKLTAAEFGDGDPAGQELAVTTAAEDLRQFEAMAATATKASTRMTSPNAIGTRRDNYVGATSTVRDASDYRVVFRCEDDRLDTGGFSSLGELLRVYAGGQHDQRVMKCADGAGLGYTSGGILIPEQFTADNLHPPTEGEVVFPRATKYGITGDKLQIGGVDGSTNASGSIHGMTAQWVPEFGEVTLQDVETAKVMLNLNKLAILNKASNELVTAMDWERIAVPAFNAAIADFRDEAYLNGDGLGKPRGAVNAPSTIEIAKEGGQAAATILYANLAKMYSRLHPALIGNAIWVVSPTCIPALLQVTVASGTAGVNYPALNESNGAFSLFGRPVLLSSKMQALGTVGDIIFADFSQYAVGVGRGIVIDRSEHYGFNRDATYWRVTYRTDGQPKWKAAFTPRNGDSLSWCVRLATRA
jgi:HK97 family phage major capsid protein